MRLVVLRHAQSQSNVLGTVSSTMPGTDITEVGIAHAIEVGQQLAGEYQFKAIYASPFRRTMHTAELVNRSLYVPIIVPDVRLVEMYAGPFDGQPVSQMLNAWQAYQEQIADLEYLAQLGGSGESEFSFYDRLMSFMLEAQARHADDTILVVTHQAPAEALYDMAVGHASHVELANTAHAECHFSAASAHQLLHRRHQLASSILSQNTA